MIEIKTYLEGVEPKNAKLYFIERDKNQRTKEVNYNTLKTTITIEIGKELVDVGLQQIISILNDDPEYIDYGIVPYSDKRHVEKINKNDVPYLSKLLIEVSTSVEVFEDTKTNKIFGYIVKIEDSRNNALFLFRKYTPKKLLEKGKLSMILNDEGSFQRLNYKIMAIDEIYDAALLLKEGDDQSQVQVFIFNRSKFESMFSFVDFYEKEVDGRKKEIDDKDLLNDIDVFIDFCKNDSRMIKKFARFLKNGEFSKMSKNNIKDVVGKYKLDLEFDDNGKVVVNKDNIWTILRILDDDYVRSEITNTKYEARSKVKK
ncbi:MAG: hypothetical protein LAKADJCE_00802 [Candidatus Argoarchaeum ethanivorans]|uniref:DUF4868 domain-containing protein n=1 Tax=Candidatus Argoarchaeum ethanivorans TaxID=2608793 RepID=A0A811TFM3_9EURY|nr:MAG: hypothetical protein LAKADJCE_00802 [Candidatus Argoarchaeum ethanivorans]